MNRILSSILFFVFGSFGLQSAPAAEVQALYNLGQ